MTEPYRVPLRLLIKRQLMRLVVRTIFRILFRVRITGKENIPKDIPYVVAANHVSHFEPPLMLSFWPRLPEALAGHDVWERNFTGDIVAMYEAIPVKRGEYDRQVFDKSLQALEAGMPLIIYPEGGRSHTPGMRRALPGVAYLVDRAQVPVLPVAVVGTRNDSFKQSLRLNRPVLEMRIGEPFNLPPITGKGAARREARQQAADLVMLKIASMLPEEYHGAYTGQVEDFPAE